MHKKYRVTLTSAEREELERLLARGKADVRCLKHAQMLLKADEAEGGPGWSDARASAATSPSTDRRTRSPTCSASFPSGRLSRRGHPRAEPPRGGRPGLI